MIYLITGGSGSGKSEYAEKVASVLYDSSKGAGTLYYIATMQARDEESVERIKRHRLLRKGKGFSTIESPTHMEQLQFESSDVLLIECMSNLLANEMFSEDGMIYNKIKTNVCKKEEFVDMIVNPLLEMEQLGTTLVIVSNEVFSDGNTYDKETEWYLELLGGVNRKLAEKAEGVVEVVCSIPVCRKGKMPC